MKLDQQSQTPLYKQVIAEILSDLQKGAYPPGTKIPSEAELSQMYSVSRVTVRRAIEELSGEGFLTSRQGKGTFVRKTHSSQKLSFTANTSFSQVCREQGVIPEVRLLNRCVVPVAQQERPFFGSSCDKLVSISCLGLVDDVPLTFEDSFLSFEVYSDLLEGDLERFSPLEQCGGVLSGCTLEAISATASLAKLLDVSLGDVLFMERVRIATDGVPLCLMNRYLVGARVQFTL